MDGAQAFKAPAPLGVRAARRDLPLEETPAAAHTPLRAGGESPAAPRMLPCCSQARRSSGLGNPLLRNDLFRNFNRNNDPVVLWYGKRWKLCPGLVAVVVLAGEEGWRSRALQGGFAMGCAARAAGARRCCPCPKHLLSRISRGQART